MDEDYLDNLLNDLSKEGKAKNRFTDNMNSDSGIDLDIDDIGDISLEELDDFDNLDLGELDFDDIDFDDIDVMKLDNTKDVVKERLPEQEEDFNLDSLIQDEPTLEPMPEVFQEPMADAASEPMPEVFQESMAEAFQESMADATMDFGLDDKEEPVTESLFSKADSGIDDVFEQATLQEQQDTSYDSNAEMDLDSLFTALGIEDDADVTDDNPNSMSSAEATFDDIEDLDEKHSKSSRKKGNGQKKSLSEILFGEPDEDDEEEERLNLIRKEKKKEKKEQKKAEQEIKKAEKASVLAVKKQKEDKEKKEKEQKKKAMLEAELEEEKGQKPVPNLVVIIVFLAFAALGGLVYFGSQFFHYSEVIRKATDYFERQRYRLAYDEVSGVEIKEKDEELRDRIYTVMYVERLYESYENNIILGRNDKALDALIRGLEKYDEHYDEAVELDIVEDINLCKKRIIGALADTYKMTEKDAYEVMALNGHEYNEALLKWCENIQTGE